MSVEEFGKVRTHVLKEGGENLFVTNDNREGKSARGAAARDPRFPSVSLAPGMQLRLSRRLAVARLPLSSPDLAS